MVAQYDHRAKAYTAGRGRAAEWEDLPFGRTDKRIQPQWYLRHDQVPSKLASRVAQFRACFCKVVSPTNERTLIATLIPPNVLCGDSVPTVLFEPEGFNWFYPFWIGIANSYSMDFIVRMKVALNLTMTVMDSLPFPRPSREDPRVRSIVERSMRLLCTSPEMIVFWNTLAEEGWVPATQTLADVPGEMDEEERLRLQAEIDAIVAHDFFELTRPELEYLLATFPTQQRYQLEKYGEFRARRLVLETYDAIAQATGTGEANGTRLNPPLVSPRIARAMKPLAAAQVQRGKVVAYLTLLLHVWKKPVTRDALEPSLIFMLNDKIRGAVLEQQSVAQISARTVSGEIVKGLNGLLPALNTNGAIVLENVHGRQTIRLGVNAGAVDSAPQTDRQRAEEAVKATQALGEDRAMTYLDAIGEARYDIVHA
jgi:hypothetical protein